jgi:hypothetical protein
METPPVLPVALGIDIVDPLLERLQQNLLCKRHMDLENGSIIFMLVSTKKYSRTAIAAAIKKSIHWVCRCQI